MPTDVTTRDLARLAVGASAEIFEWPGNRVLKLFKAGFPRDAIERELHQSRLAHALGVATPRAEGLAALQGRIGIVFERCDGPTMYDLIARQAQPAPALAAQFFAAQRTVHGCSAPALQPLAEKLARRVAQARGVPEPARQAALELLAAAPQGEALCHGDFHPVNVIVRAQGAVVIDWLDAARGDPAMDVTRTLVYLRHARPGAVDAGFRAVFVEAYVEQCRQAWTGRLDELTRWQLPVALARLAEPVDPTERAALLDLVDALA
jgi:aminoglycoside phosphotransferase (APT) family kinase protein